MIKARAPNENSFNTCTPAQVYYVRPTCVLRNGIMHAGYSQVCRHVQGMVDTIPGRSTMRLTQDYRICTPMVTAMTTTFFVFIRPPTFQSIHQTQLACLIRDGLIIVSHKAPYHHHHRLQLHSVIRISLTTADAVFRVSSLLYIVYHIYSSIRDMFSCLFVHNRVAV